MTMRGKTLTTIAITATSAVALTACGQAGQTASGGSQSDGGDGPAEITMWTHSAGSPGALEVYDQTIADFNESQDQYEVVRQDFPQDSYNDSVVAAAGAGDLPCIVDIDGPIVSNWAWAGYLQPLGLSEELIDELLPTAVGRYKDEVYSAGYSEAALAIFARESVLTQSGIRIPTFEEPWTVEEFDAALVTLQGAGYGTPIDIGAEDSGEWYSYAYSPMLQSAGGDLIDRETMLTADGALNGPEAVEYFQWLQSAFERGLTSNQGVDGNQEFVDDEVALSYTGVWKAMEALENVGDDLLILPPPDFGNGPKIGGASWQFGISTDCESPEGAREYLEFSFQPEYVAQFADTQVVIPVTEEAQEQSEYFSEDGALHPFVELSERYALERPPTPAYAVISSVFETAVKDIMSGADVKATLDQAVQEIDTNIESNDGYGF